MSPAARHKKTPAMAQNLPFGTRSLVLFGVIRFAFFPLFWLLFFFFCRTTGATWPELQTGVNGGTLHNITTHSRAKTL